MPNFSGIWSAAQQFQARGQNIWPKPPDAPTIGTATAGTNNCASVAFTAPACTGKYPSGVSTYTATSTPGCFTASGAASPLTVTGLTTGTSYTFKVKANGSNGLTGPCSAASNSVTATVKTCATYCAPGTYSWVAPTGVTSVAVVAVGGGGNYSFSASLKGGQGGSLAYKNAIAVTPGSSYTVVVGAGGGGACASSYFNTTGTVKAPNGANGNQGIVSSGRVGDGGGYGGAGGNGQCAGPQGAGGGGGAGGYSGNGGAGGNMVKGSGSAGAGGGGGGGGAASCASANFGAGGGGVGLFGAGSNGAGGQGATYPSTGGGGGSGGSQGSSSSSGAGGNYGGGGGGNPGAGGAVRIVWAGGARGTPSFPSTNVGP